MPLSRDDLEEFTEKYKQRRELNLWFMEFRRSGKYREVLHELIDRAPVLISVNWGMVLRHNILK